MHRKVCKYKKNNLLWFSLYIFFIEIEAYHPKKFYLSHSGKWMQNGYSLSHSSTFTCTTPEKARNSYGFTGVVKVTVLEWFKENATCIHLPEWLKYIFLRVCWSTELKKLIIAYGTQFGHCASWTLFDF